MVLGRNPPSESSESAYTRSGRKVNCYQPKPGRFWSSCDISATKRGLPSYLDPPEKPSVVKPLEQNWRRSHLRANDPCWDRGSRPRELTLPVAGAAPAPNLGSLRFSACPARKPARKRCPGHSRSCNFGLKVLTPKRVSRQASLVGRASLGEGRVLC